MVSATAAPRPVAKPATRPRSSVVRMQSMPMGPTGAATAKPIPAPFTTSQICARNASSMVTAAPGRIDVAADADRIDRASLLHGRERDDGMRALDAADGLHLFGEKAFEMAGAAETQLQQIRVVAGNVMALQDLRSRLHAREKFRLVA